LTQEQVLLAILGALLIANVILVASIPFRIRRGRPAPDPVAAIDHAEAADPRAVAAIEGFVDGVSREEEPRSPAASEPGRDPLAALADPTMWSRAIGEETERVARFGHPATVVMAELPHLDRLVGAFGRGVADRVVTETARVLVSEGRESDRITQLGEARFGILLAETEEGAAGAYVERVRAATGNWLESVGLLGRLSFGWASPGEGQTVANAAVTAEERMHEASRRALVRPSSARQT
jgi:diguanylate cyclase (GGDEF)-like protein